MRPPTRPAEHWKGIRKIGCINNSVDHLLELLHWEHTHGLAGWLGLEDTWLFGEGVHPLASFGGRLLLQLRVERSAELELDRCLFTFGPASSDASTHLSGWLFWR